MMLFDQFKKERYMIVGLGNPGKKYENTRHNAGFMALDVLEKEWGASPFGNKKTATLSKATVGGKEVLLVRPLTFMNLSGNAVHEVGSYYKIPAENIIVIADDVSMAVGRMRIRDKGSDGGHNGLKDIIRVLGTDRLMRIKIGVGQKPHPDYDLADWVLGKIPKEDLPVLKEVLETVPGAARLLIGGDLAKAQNQYNR
ncbi:MAG: aminoacyl-tRNA hydrolase [Clostridia bacterium]|nr:aminoacyl-tRNA hydrolase [Clostridia bacterium]